jgi:hypothetical protein
MMQLDWPAVREKLKDAIFTLPHFFKNPVQGMRRLPTWEWPETLILQGLFAMICAVLGNLVQKDFIGMVLAIVVGPVMSWISVGLAAGFFYYVFLFFFQRELTFKQIYMHVLFASLPVWLLSIVAPLAPPVKLIGVGAALILLFVGFVDNFSLAREKTRNMMLALMLGYTIGWIANQIRETTRHDDLRIKATPESMDILEKELGK